ncbi:MAG TPA: hypothetical protein VK145_01915 [Candidatus Nanoarchaeia archaeon]|nr:hypothetical protein [Candidatus Nanoarchaeia archaeon]
MSIPKDSKKINIIVLISICVVLGIMLISGSLKISAISRAKEPIRVVPPVLDFTGQNKAKSAQFGMVIASKTGTKYHLPECPGAKTIAEKNKITFDSIAAAERAGYAPAANCPGLKNQ